ncbi:MAG: GntR family transcriptional regulator [Armatimonadota bacterium]
MDDYSFDNTLKSDRLRDVLKQSLITESLQPGDRLPSEPELVTRYKVSRSTVREAITALVQEGLLYRIQGKGTFVAEPKPEHRTLAVVLPYLFFSDSLPLSAGTDVVPRLMQAVEAEARRVGANILLYLDNHLPALERENIANLLERRVDGVLLNYIGNGRNLDAVQRIGDSGVPLVLIDRYIEGMPLDFVVTDNALGAYRATKLLIAQGFPRVVHITSPGENSALRDRRAGYERAMREEELPHLVLSIEERHIDEQGMDTVSEEERAYRLAQTLLQTVELPFAVFTTDSPILAGLWRAILDHGLPHDRLAFACFDEPFVNFPKTVFSLKVIQPFREIGRRSINILQERIAGTGPAEPYQIFLEPEIITSKV